MGIESIIGGTVGLIGSGMEADAASDAAAQQSAATDRANARLEEQFRQTRSDLAPWRTSGAQANNRLSQLLGLGGVSGGRQAMTYEQARQQLLPQYTKPRAQIADAPSPYWGHNSDGWAVVNSGFSPANRNFAEGGENGQADVSVDESALSEAIRNLMMENGGMPDSQASDYGSLLRNFTGEDLANEPGYQFGLTEGIRARDQSAASRGMLLSGAALKSANRFGNDYASTKFGDAYNRDSNNKTRTYNFLTGQSSAGQNAAAQTGTMGANVAAQVGSNLTNLGNAQGASTIAQGNAWAGGLNNAVQGYQQNQLMQSILGGNQGWSTPPIYGDRGR